MVPGWRFSAAAPAQWQAAELGWGPLYEPHRHPAGAVLGRRLPLPPGGYVVEVELQALAPAPLPARVMWSLDRPGATWHALPAAGPLRFSADWLRLEWRRDAIDLRLGNGPPAFVQAVRILPSAQP
jgi:hypothetical protein